MIASGWKARQTMIVNTFPLISINIPMPLRINIRVPADIKFVKLLVHQGRIDLVGIYRQEEVTMNMLIEILMNGCDYAQSSPNTYIDSLIHPVEKVTYHFFEGV